MKISAVASQLLRRVATVLMLFVVASGLIGSRIISGDILYRDGFAVYGSLGKVLIFGAVAFLLLVWRKKKFNYPLSPWQPQQGWWLALTAVLYFAAWQAVSRLIAGESVPQLVIVVHTFLLMSMGCLVMGVLGLKNVRLLWQAFKREIRLAGVFAVVFFLFLSGVYALWQPLATGVLHAVNGLLGIIGLSATVVPPRTLVFDKFGITVAQYCSGIESIALFSGLYAIVGFLDWGRLNKQRFLLLFPLALSLLFALNIVRVFALIVAGYYVNQRIAFSLFHSYAGMLFFVLYSVVFWAIAYKYLINKGRLQNEENSCR